MRMVQDVSPCKQSNFSCIDDFYQHPYQASLVDRCDSVLTDDKGVIACHVCVQIEDTQGGQSGWLFGRGGECRQPCLQNFIFRIE